MNLHKVRPWIALVAVAVLAGSGSFFVNKFIRSIYKKQTSSSEKYDELEFTIIHRPHITYLIDTKYSLCFATRKPDFQDLVQIECPDRMWEDAGNGKNRRKR